MTTMSYVELADLEAALPLDFLTQALDDNQDGTIDAWTSVQSAACRAVNALLGTRYTVLFTSPYPAIVTEAAFLFAAEACYTRRGVEPKNNPFFARANSIRDQLLEIGKGEAPLDPNIQRSKPSASIITSPARTHSDRISV